MSHNNTTSTSCVYSIKKNDSNDIDLHFIVETKSENSRLSDKIAIDTQKRAFEVIGGNIHWEVETDVVGFERDLKKMTIALKNEKITTYLQKYTKNMYFCRYVAKKIQ